MGLRGTKVKDVTMQNNLMNKSRKCRDVFCIPIFLAFWTGMILVLYIALKNGNPNRLIFASDFKGNLCGTNDLQNKTDLCYEGSSCGKYIVYPKLDEDLYAADLGGLLEDPADLINFPFYGLCRNSCPEGDNDLNKDQLIDDWVCDYETMRYINEVFGKNEANIEIPSHDGKIALEACLMEKISRPFLLGLTTLPSALLLPSGDSVNCQILMKSCWKMYVPEQPFFFRCIATPSENITCTNSPYLRSINEPVTHYYDEDGIFHSRTVADPDCGECIEPKLDSEGSIMRPSDSTCKVRKIVGASETIQAQVNPILGSINSWTAVLQNALGDVYNGIPYIICTGAVVPFLLGIIWLLFLRLAARFFVFSVLYGLFFFLSFLSIQFLIYGEVITPEILASLIDSINNATGFSLNSDDISSSITSVDLFETETDNTTDTYAILGYCLTAITIFYFMLLFVLNRRIKIAVAIIKEATVAISAMPTILCFPIVTVAFTLSLGGYWGYVMLYLVTMNELEVMNVTGTIDINGINQTARALLPQAYDMVPYNFYTASSTAADLDQLTVIISNHLVDLPYLEIFFLYHLMGYFWTNQFIQAVGATVVAGAVGSWYWSTHEEGQKTKSLKRFPIIKSFWRASRYHLGSLLFGSFIVALVQVLRAVLMYIDKQTQGLQKKNKFVAYLMKGIQCCLCVLEKVLKFITKNAYIYIALFGNSFCKSTAEVFKIMVANFARIGVATAVSSLIILLGKILIVSVSCFLCITLLSLHGTENKIVVALSHLSLDGENTPPSSIVPPVIMSGLLAWFVSSCFMSIYALTIDTLLISLCVDEQQNDGSVEKPFYMTKSLKKLTRKWNKKSKKVHDNSSQKTSSSKTEK